MNKEEYKLALLRVAKEEPAIIRILMLEKNEGAQIRTAVFAIEKVYTHSKYDLLIRFRTDSISSETINFNIQFCDGLTPPLEWCQNIQGDLANVRELSKVVYEKIEIKNDIINFYQYGMSIFPQEDAVPLKCKTIIYRGVDYDLNKGFLNTVFMYIAKSGRSRSHLREECYIDCVIGENEYQELLRQLSEWANRNHFNQSEMGCIYAFCEYCRSIKSTKRKSKMVRIIEYLRDNPLPCRTP